MMQGHKPQWSVPKSLAGTAFAFPAALMFVNVPLMVLVFGLAAILGLDDDWWQAMAIMTLAVGFVGTCILSRKIFMDLRWHELPRDGSYCLNCTYNLTGNVSGICPECGTPIPGTSAGSP